MTKATYGRVFIDGLIETLLADGLWAEVEAPDGGAFLPLTLADDPTVSAGSVRLWRGRDDSPLDRMVHMCLLAGPVETHLLFAFGRADSSMPHLHAQVVQFPPDGCVYNVDFLPRLDAVEYPDWYTRVFSNLRRPYRLATSDTQYTCAHAPANPALAIYMSPWGIASGRTVASELEAVTPHIEAYVAHYCALAREHDWAQPDGLDLAARDDRHLRLFFADELDPRAWNGVYKVIGESRGSMIKALLRNPQRPPSSN